MSGTYRQQKARTAEKLSKYGLLKNNYGGDDRDRTDYLLNAIQEKYAVEWGFIGSKVATE